MLYHLNKKGKMDLMYHLDRLGFYPVLDYSHTCKCTRVLARVI